MPPLRAQNLDFSKIISLVADSERVERLFEEYFKTQSDSFRDINNAYQNEAGAKLNQVTYALKAIYLAQREYSFDLLNPEMMKRIGFYAEAFYLFAFRAKKAISYVPGLFEISCEGVRNVRNHLIQHPEGRSSQIVFGGLVITPEGGPIVKGIRYAAQGDLWQSSGLYIDAGEFLGEMLQMLTFSISSAVAQDR